MQSYLALCAAECEKENVFLSHWHQLDTRISSQQNHAIHTTLKQQRLVIVSVLVWCHCRSICQLLNLSQLYRRKSGTASGGVPTPSKYLRGTNTCRRCRNVYIAENGFAVACVVPKVARSLVIECRLFDDAVAAVAYTDCAFSTSAPALCFEALKMETSSSFLSSSRCSIQHVVLYSI